MILRFLAEGCFQNERGDQWQRLFPEVAGEDFGGTSIASEAGLLPAEPAVTSVVHFDEDS